MTGSLDRDAAALARVLEAIPEVVLVLDREGAIRYMNHVESGYDREAFLGTQADVIMSPESKEVFRAAFQSVLLTGEVAEYDTSLTAPDGGIRWYRSRMIPIYVDGQVAEVTVIATNVTELREAQEVADQLRRLLPMCAWCDRIRSEKGAWETIEAYLEREQRTRVSHGMCPECQRKHLEALGLDDGNAGHVA